MHVKSFPEQDFFEIAFVPTGGEAFVLDADLERVLVFQQAERRAAEDAESSHPRGLGGCGIGLPEM